MYVNAPYLPFNFAVTSESALKKFIKNSEIKKKKKFRNQKLK